MTLAKEVVNLNTILLCEVGSTVHGLGVGTDDRDEMGICIEPKEYVIGLKHFEQNIFRTQPEGVRSGPGDIDRVIYGLRKYCSLALKGNPSVLLLLMVPDEKCMVKEAPADWLRNEKYIFASKMAGAAFLGYMEQQRARMTGERGQMNVSRPELVAAYGYDTKYAGHILRLGFQGIEYMTTGKFTVPMIPYERDYIVSVRKGKVGLNEMLTRAGELEHDLKTAISSSPLPPTPNYNAVNSFLINAYDWWWPRD